MQPNPYSDEPINSQPTERNPIPPQQGPSPYAPDRPYAQGDWNRQPYPQNQVSPDQRAARAYQERERAHTFAYGVAKFMDYLRWVLAVLEVLFLLRFLFRLIGADPSNPFASFLYNFTGIFLAPFQGIVRDPSFGTSTLHVFEWTTLIGMAVYAVFFWIIYLLLRTTISRPEEPVS